MGKKIDNLYNDNIYQSIMFTIINLSCENYLNELIDNNIHSVCYYTLEKNIIQSLKNNNILFIKDEEFCDIVYDKMCQLEDLIQKLY